MFFVRFDASAACRSAASIGACSGVRLARIDDARRRRALLHYELTGLGI